MNGQYQKFNIKNDNLIDVMNSEKWVKSHHNEFTIKYNGKAVEDSD